MTATDKSLTKMALADIPMGKEVPGYANSWDYSHVLPPEHRRDYRLMVYREHPKFPGGRDTLTARLKYTAPGTPSREHNLGTGLSTKPPFLFVGSVTGYLNSYQNSIEPHSTLHDSHRGKGLGLAMYGGLFAHARHSGIKTVAGGIHSQDAARVHKKLAARHGLEYKARTSTGGLEPTDKTPYQYALKSENSSQTSSEKERSVSNREASGSSPESGSNFGINEDGYQLQDKYLFQGLPIAIENKKGSTRKWHDPDGKERGSTKMNHDYGYIEDCRGSDGDSVDVYVGPDEDAKLVYVVHQNKAPDFSEYDEDKVMLGFPSEEAAREAYLKQYNDERFYSGMSSMSVQAFKEKLAEGGKITNKSELEKSMLPAVMATALAAVPSHKLATWSPKGLHHELIPIAHLESSFGKHMNHAADPRGEFHTAVGALGLKPQTAHEEYLRSPSLQKLYPGLTGPHTFLEKFKGDSQFYNLTAGAHWLHLKKLLGSPDRAAYGWRHGIGAAQKRTDYQVDPYVKRYSVMTRKKP